jgi:hypothetical protein
LPGFDYEEIVKDIVGLQRLHQNREVVGLVQEQTTLVFELFMSRSLLKKPEEVTGIS